MKTKYLNRPTTYIVKFWSKDGSTLTREEFYPMHLYPLDEVISKLKGKEDVCDIYEGRYSKRCGTYIINGNTYIWDACNWALQM